MRSRHESSRPQIVLAGGGHAHVEVIRRIGEWRLPADVTLISPSGHTPYSGMLPGFIAGDYTFDDMHIDLDALCRRAGVDFRRGTAEAIDAGAQRVALSDGETLAYDLLSLDIGSRPDLPDGSAEGIPVKPIANFAQRLSELDALVNGLARPFRLAIVGQGVAGVELALALKRRFARAAQHGNLPGFEVILIGRADAIMPGRSRIARWLVLRALKRHGIGHRPAFDVATFRGGEVKARDGRALQVDALVWATSSGAPRWLQQTGLDLDAAGFVRVDRSLRSLSHPNVFAAGDVASLRDPRPKSGVFAVRAGPVLADNIRRWVAAEPLAEFHPQRHALAIISLADGRAIADKWGLAVSGRWVERWKRWNDRSFVHRYRAGAPPQ